MRRSRPALLAVVLLILTAAPVAAAPPKDAARAEHQRIVRYWTAAQQSHATPRDFVRAGTAFAPAAKPDNGKGKPGSGSGDVTGASWTKGGEILKASGKVFFTMGSSNYTCSGSVANDSRANFSLVLTAAHCAYDEVAGEFATNWLFIPEYDSAPTSNCASTTYGCWTAQALVVHDGYATAGGFNTQATVHDFAFAVVGAGGKSGGHLDATVGAFSIQFSGVSVGDKLYAFGYPAAGKYKGKDLTYCAGPIFTDAWNDDLTWGMKCTMTGGSSGGPWLASFDETTGSGTLSSLNSYGYAGVKAMYGPKFNSNTQAVHTSADGATSNTIVGP